jgi:hypothetical protein
VKKKNRHIDKYLRDQLPDPEVPAEDAWAQMNGMLNTTPVEISNAGKVGKAAAKLVKLKTAIGVLLATASLPLWILFGPDHDTPSNVSQKITEKAVVAAETLAIENRQTEIADRPNKSELHENKNAPQPDTTHIALPAITHGASFTEKTKSATTKTQIRKSEVNMSRAGEDERIPNQAKQLFGKTESSPLIVLKNDGKALKNPESPRQHAAASELDMEAGRETAGELSSKNTSETANNTASSFKLHKLKSIGPHFPAFHPDLGKRVLSQNFIEQPGETAVKKNGRTRTIHAGLEWNFNMTFKGTDYLFTGVDSIQGFPKIFIPGLFIAKNWQRHALSVSVLPYQSYFGDGAKISHVIDSTISTDSSKFYNNKRFIKTLGTTFNLQYQYQITRSLALNAGASYHAISSALIRLETENYRGDILPGALVTLKKSGEIRSNINPHLFTIKAGILFSHGPFQGGFNVILPLSGISKSPQFPVKALNGQMFLRYAIW